MKSIPKSKKAELVYEEPTYQIIGIAMKVHRELGPGFLEAVYEEAIAMEFKESSIPFRQKDGVRYFVYG